ncbi:MAG: c-type cytochrome [Silvanigrellales bacterium]|jgi:mono/diheme cytochrome c family protein|nr:c-type cytochrome [Silvanigrellales bacterium]
MKSTRSAITSLACAGLLSVAALVACAEESSKDTGNSAPPQQPENAQDKNNVGGGGGSDDAKSKPAPKIGKSVATPIPTVPVTGPVVPPAALTADFQTFCAGCHGAQGEGRGRFPALVGTTLSLDAYVTVVADGRTGPSGKMPSFFRASTPGGSKEWRISRDSVLADFDFLRAKAQPEPSAQPTSEPTVEPTAQPTVEPTAQPTVEPTAVPTLTPPSLSTAFVENCAGCHGDAGEGGFGPRLLGTALSPAQYTRFVRNGSGAMPAFSAESISDADVANDFALFTSGL